MRSGYAYPFAGNKLQEAFCVAIVHSLSPESLSGRSVKETSNCFYADGKDYPEKKITVYRNSDFEYASPVWLVTPT